MSHENLSFLQTGVFERIFIWKLRIFLVKIPHLCNVLCTLVIVHQPLPTWSFWNLDGSGYPDYLLRSGTPSDSLDVWNTCLWSERPWIVWMYRSAYRDMEVLELTEYLDISMLWVTCFFLFLFTCS